jgi:hypothetical protein
MQKEFDFQLFLPTLRGLPPLQNTVYNRISPTELIISFLLKDKLNFGEIFSRIFPETK